MKRTLRYISVFMSVLMMGILNLTAQDQKKIFINQVGFYPDGKKIAIVHDVKAASFTVVTEEGRKRVYKGKLSEPVKSQYSDKMFRTADFSGLQKPGKYIVVVPGTGESYPFQVRNEIHRDIAAASIKNYYFQRLSIPLQEKFAGKWHRPAGHPDQKVRIHSSAVSSSRPVNTVISSPRGWYDAGDYNKYIVNSGITMGTMFSAYEEFPQFYQRLNLDIPESTNQVPDILDELLWNLRWMMTMQDPEDGGVYHKLTNPDFDKMVMPHEANEPRYVVQKGTAATLDFSAVMAQASRIFRNFENDLPGLADSCLVASQKAWAWSQRNPLVVYNQNEINKNHDPDITTGAYGDNDFSDELIWAAAELFVTTSEQSYLDLIKPASDPLVIPSWNQVRTLGYYTLLRFQNRVPSSKKEIIDQIQKQLFSKADEMIAGSSKTAFKTVMGQTVKDYIWGSSSVAANQGILLMNAYRLSGKKQYIEAAVTNLDYLLGRNATGYSFVTGFGSKQVMHPHHRPSEADGIKEPIPGMLSGGPNPGMQDKCNYPTSIPEEAFTDDVCSYASNEIAINWNAPLVYLSGAIEAAQQKQ